MHDESRVAWVDYAKGFCIVFVVMMHSTLGVGNTLGQEGWLHSVVAFAKPFRMPDFFLISGLFLSVVSPTRDRQELLMTTSNTAPVENGKRSSAMARTAPDCARRRR